MSESRIMLHVYNNFIDKFVNVLCRFELPFSWRNLKMSEQKQRNFSKKMSHYLLWWRRSLDLRGAQYFFHLMGWAYTTTDCASM